MTDDHERPPTATEKAPQSAERVQGVDQEGRGENGAVKRFSDAEWAGNWSQDAVMESLPKERLIDEIRVWVDRTHRAVDRAERAEAERDAALAKVARVLNWLEVRDVKYPERFGRTPSENYVKGYTAARVSLRAALADEEPG